MGTISGEMPEGVLPALGGRLYFTGLSQNVYDQMQRIGKLHLSEAVRAYQATPTIGESIQKVYA